MKECSCPEQSQNYALALFARAMRLSQLRTKTKAAIIDETVMALSQLYSSNSVLGAADELLPALRPEQWAGRTEIRAPRVWISKCRVQLSTLDVLRRDCVLLTESERRSSTAKQAGVQRGIQLPALRIGADLPPAGGVPFTLNTRSRRLWPRLAKRLLTPSYRSSPRMERFEDFKAMSLRQLEKPRLITEACLTKTVAELAVIQCEETPLAPEVFRREYRTALGTGPEGASLIRPDGFVAWRYTALQTDVDGVLTEASALWRLKLGLSFVSRDGQFIFEKM
jgi:putative polyketide hydroxylase